MKKFMGLFLATLVFLTVSTSLPLAAVRSFGEEIAPSQNNSFSGVWAGSDGTWRGETITETFDNDGIPNFSHSAADVCLTWQEPQCGPAALKTATISQFVGSLPPGKSRSVNVVSGGVGMPVCRSKAQTFCVLSIEESIDGRNWRALAGHTLSLLRSQGLSPANEPFGIPASSAGTEWKSILFPGYSVIFQSASSLRVLQGKLIPPHQQVKLNSRGEIVVSDEIASDVTASMNFAREQQFTKWADPKCIFISDVMCFENRAFPAGYLIRLQLQTPKWFGKYLVVKASKANYRLDSNVENFIELTLVPALMSSASGLDTGEPRGLGGSGGLANTEKLYGGKATGQNSQIAFSFVSGLYSNCPVSSPILAMSVSDAAVLPFAPPVISEGSFLISLFDMHAQADGAITRRNFSFDIDQKYAKCWEQLDNLPVGVSVSITDENGLQKTAVVTSEVDKGRFKFSATGITFSEPKIKFTLKSSKKIICQNVKNPAVKRTISGISPKCPSGFKLKP